MKKRATHNKIVIILALVMVFICVSIYVFIHNMNELNDHIEFAFGSSVANFAAHLASSLDITDQQFENLKKTDFLSAITSEANLALKEEAENEGDEANIKYIYLLSQLSDDEVRYHIDSSNSSRYERPAGTPMDGIWLLDVPILVDEDMKAEIDSKAYYEDIRRYTVLSQKQKDILTSQKGTYSVIKDEWGEFLTGFAPVYSTSGNYIGMLGVDMHLNQMVGIKREIIVNLFVAYILVVGTLLVMFLLIYQKYWKIKNQQLYLDPLTSAYNRRYFNEMFEGSLRIKKNLDKFLVLVMFDIDFFKKVNDKYGHEMGDICLKGITDAIVKVLFIPPNILVRYGGEEFLAAMTVGKNEEADDIVKKIMDNIRNLDMMGDGTRITVSAGGAVLPYSKIESTNMDFVIKVADDNLYYCKKHGRDKFLMTDYSESKNESI